MCIINMVLQTLSFLPGTRLLCPGSQAGIMAMQNPTGNTAMMRLIKQRMYINTGPAGKPLAARWMVTIH